jgi:O-antigen ligase
MKGLLRPLIVFQPLFIPVLLCVALWAVWRIVIKRDYAIGLVLYISLVVVVDGFMNTGLFLPGMEKGSIHYSEVLAAFMLANQPSLSTTWAPRKTILCLVGIYFSLLFLSMLRTDPLLPSVFEFRRLIVPQIVGFLVARRGLGSPDGLRRFFAGLTTLIGLIALFIAWDLFFDRTILKSDMLDNPIYWFNREKNRFGSFFLNPNYLAGFIVMVFPPMFVWMLSEQQRSRRIYALIGLMALAFSLVQTQSRAPLLAFGATMMLLILGPSTSVSRARRMAFVALFAGVYFAISPGALSHAVQRFNTLNTEETAENGRSRQTTWRYTAMMIAEHPIGGIGFGESQFMRSMNELGYTYEFGGESLDAPHNSFLQATAYAGIPALLALLLANGLTLGRAFLISLKRRPVKNGPYAFGLAVGITGFLACVTTDLQLFSQMIAPVYWTFFGLFVSVVQDAYTLSADDGQPTLGAASGPSAPPRPFGAGSMRPAPFSRATR